MGPKVSVIVPVYNVEAYLPRCLDSLRGQTLTDIEILLIDDGSPDGSGAIADRYAREDGRFRVVHQQNAGLSAARNRGIELSSAPYLMFVDSDDWVEPDYCRIPYEAAEKQGADMVLFRFYTEEPKGAGVASTSLPAGALSREEAMGLLYHGADVVAWNKLYRRRLFAEVRYPEGRVYEDHGTTSKLVQLAERPWALDMPLYHYRIRRDSIGNTDTGKHVRDRLDMFRTEARWLEENGYPALARERYARVALSYLIRMGLEAEWSPECLRILREEKRPVPDLDRLNAWMLALLRLSPFLFDRVSVLCGMRRWQREGGGEG